MKDWMSRLKAKREAALTVLTTDELNDKSNHGGILDGLMCINIMICSDVPVDTELHLYGCINSHKQYLPWLSWCSHVNAGIKLFSFIFQTFDGSKCECLLLFFALSHSKLNNLGFRTFNDMIFSHVIAVSQLLNHWQINWITEINTSCSPNILIQSYFAVLRTQVYLVMYFSFFLISFFLILLSYNYSFFIYRSHLYTYNI